MDTYAAARNELDNVLQQLDRIIEEIYKMADKIGCQPWEVRDASGRILLQDPVIAKCNALIAISNWEL